MSQPRVSIEDEDEREHEDDCPGFASPTRSSDNPPMVNERVQSLALDLTKTSPRSPRASLGDYKVLAARALDKCRAELAGTAGSYHFNCPLDQTFFRFIQIDSEKFKTFVATGASDQQVAEWISKESKIQDRSKIATWALLFQLNPINLVLDIDDWFHRRKQRA
jgi:hypothetical protein